MTDANDDFVHVAADYVAADTLHGMVRERYVSPTLPAPLRRAVAVAHDDPSLPQNARKIATLAVSVGWKVRVTTAYGYDSDSSGGPRMDPIKEPTGELTEKTNRPAMKTVGHVQAPPVHSFRVVILDHRGILYVAHWLSDGTTGDLRWDHGMVIEGRTVKANVNWTRMQRELNESAADMRREDPAAGRDEGQLPLDL